MPKGVHFSPRGTPNTPVAILRADGHPVEAVIASTMPIHKPQAVEDDPVASEEWDRLLGAMPANLVDALDQVILELYATSYSMLYHAAADIRENGYTISGERGDKANPAVSAWGQAADKLIKASDRLGLGPSLRARTQGHLKLGGVATREDRRHSKFKGLLGGRTE